MLRGSRPVTRRPGGGSDTGTVYFLGAGFAKACKGPSQAEIWPWVREYPNGPAAKLSGIREHGQKFMEARGRVEEFIAALFGPDAQPPLEHVFTTLDLAIARDQFLGDTPPSGLRAIRGDLVACITLLFRAVLREHRRRGIAGFHRAVGNRPRILTTNWDLLAERELGRSGALPDYGFPILPCRFISTDVLTRIRPRRDHMLRGTEPLVLKLHGSLNWLLCRACDQIMAVSSKAAHHEYVERPACPVCGCSPGKRQGPLISQIVTPTFLKYLTPPHFQQTWFRAARELRKASRLVFVGYSLPLADYEIVALLTRNLRPDAEVRAVLYDCSRDRTEIADNYRDVFGPSRCRFNFGGVAGWLASPNRFPDE